MTDLTDRIALVTGASRGIGRAAAMGLAQAGAHVVALARGKSVGALEALDDAIRQETGRDVTLVPLNLTDAKGIDNLGAALFDRFGRLDILVANAGILGPLSPVGHIEPKDWDKTVAINLTANFRLIRSLDPLLQRAEAGRAIFVTSGAVQKCRAFWSAYSATKAGLEALVKSYAHEVENSPVRANLLDPGPTRTAMRAQAFPGEEPETLPAPEALVPLFVKLADPNLTANGEVFRFSRG
ncbi:MAG: SDR family NAD(P)-dependent oxidoreductase [Rhodothalassiaceae bacterium]